MMGFDYGTNDTTGLALVLHDEGTVYVCNYGNVPPNTLATKLDALAAALAASSLVIEPRERESLGEWGWWAAHYPPTPYRREIPSANPSFGWRRPQARACRVDRARWKRRRFVQRLRRRA